MLSKRVAFSFSVHKLGTFSSNIGKVNFDSLVHLFRYSRNNKNLVLNYYAYIEDAHLSDLLIQATIKNKNQLMVLSGSSWKYCRDTVRIKRSYIIFYQGGPIDHVTHVTLPVSQASAESKYNTS